MDIRMGAIEESGTVDYFIILHVGTLTIIIFSGEVHVVLEWVG